MLRNPEADANLAEQAPAANEMIRENGAAAAVIAGMDDVAVPILFDAETGSPNTLGNFARSVASLWPLDSLNVFIPEDDGNGDLLAICADSGRTVAATIGLDGDPHEAPPGEHSTAIAAEVGPVHADAPGVPDTDQIASMRAAVEEVLPHEAVAELDARAQAAAGVH